VFTISKLELWYDLPVECVQPADVVLDGWYEDEENIVRNRMNEGNSLVFYGWNTSLIEYVNRIEFYIQLERIRH